MGIPQFFVGKPVKLHHLLAPRMRRLSNATTARLLLKQKRDEESAARLTQNHVPGTPSPLLRSVRLH